MCGIVGGVSTRDVVPILVQGLQRLEYRGYDSCGVAVYDQGLKRSRSTARVAELLRQVCREDIKGQAGIAHTRWATHGAPALHNAHPHFSHGTGTGMPQRAARIALVHNGIIENHDELRRLLQAQGYEFQSQTDTEVICHLVDSLYEGDLFQAVRRAVARLRGAYAVAVLCTDNPQHMVGARAGSPLILGVGKQDGEHFLASDAMALAGVTDQIVYLEEGDIVDVELGGYRIEGRDRTQPGRPVCTVSDSGVTAELGPYRHYMQKEIFEQPRAIAETIRGVGTVLPRLFGGQAKTIFQDIDSVLILACGTSYYSGCVARYWLEGIARIPTQVEIASEFRYRDSIPNPKTLVVTLSQSGETADTLAALAHARGLGMEHTLTICNVATSAMVRECKLAYVTRGGAEIGVASTKAFTTQLASLFLLVLVLARMRGHLSAGQAAQHVSAMHGLSDAVSAVLALEPQVISWARGFAGKENALFLGRGMHQPIAMEGALKLKEITYIHAEAYAAGELKHGPLALVTREMPVVVVAPNDALLDKLKSNMAEVRARGGVLYVLADAQTRIQNEEGIHVIRMPVHPCGPLSPILHVVPLQLLAYHTACARGTDVDKPRNLAKSVTVE
jgi:glucosamine--fructose-6-phosphate aminotransferase (isomerizing)